MLRRRLSAGALRAQAHLHTQTPAASPKARVTPAAAAAKATISPSAHSKSLGSVVLLNTQRNWKGEKVVTLKAELKKRGLTQTGNKATLVSRLESADKTGLAPPVPPLSRAQKRAYASGSKNDRDDIPPVMKAFEDMTVNAPPGGEVSSFSRQTSEDKSDLSAEEQTSAPGLPSGKKTGPVPQEFTIHFPDPQKVKDTSQTIPTMPDFLGKSSSSGKESDKDDNFGLPNVSTVAPTSTHPDGGPVHGTTKVKDVDELRDKVEASVKEQVQAAKEAVTEVQQKMAEQLKSGKEDEEKLLEQSGLSKEEIKAVKEAENTILEQIKASKKAEDEMIKIGREALESLAKGASKDLDPKEMTARLAKAAKEQIKATKEAESKIWDQIKDARKTEEKILKQSGIDINKEVKEHIKAAKQAEHRILEQLKAAKDAEDKFLKHARRAVNNPFVRRKVEKQAKEQIDAAKRATTEILELSGITVDNPDDPLGLEGSGTYKSSSRPLNSDEKGGVWLLAGLLGGVAVAGWYYEKKKKDDPKHKKL
ncbi:hypothetical protein CspeluHIS016_0105260 [Cutaneotrichosporon spelunceum]|uniref:SAP domain-containing protein n=1 Tax=Cutaneotrichosporon spelunceum TaxID=1672016 RepID=A0AAD3TNI7_9TREE|nr:hypothetical protein CspeluHIS016_0105260 [Cutaneotrichosporon spelunceum]